MGVPNVSIGLLSQWRHQSRCLSLVGMGIIQSTEGLNRTKEKLEGVLVTLASLIQMTHLILSSPALRLYFALFAVLVLKF